MAGIYIHIPFCIRKCPYCDFYSGPMTAEKKQRYIEALRNQLAAAPHIPADTVYFGGGTPSLLEAEDVAEILSAVKKVFILSEDAEVSLEINPATCSTEKLRGLLRAGINRLSIGVQSTDDEVLRALGRLHSGKDALAAIADAKAAGFTNISADLMLATPKSSEESLKRSIDELTAAGVTHLSAYLLKIMEGTPYYINTPSLPDEDEAADQYEYCCSLMEEKGFAQYEISNFAIEGFESRHNLKYWRMEDYYGFGPAAHSCFGGRRYSTESDIDGFIERFSSPSPCISCGMAEGEELTDEDMIVTALRTAEGLDLTSLKERFGRDLLAEKSGFIGSCCKAGLMEQDGSRIAITKKGFLVSNSILAELI